MSTARATKARHKRFQKSAQKHPQPGKDAPEVVANGGEKGVGGIAGAAFEIAVAEMAFGRIVPSDAATDHGSPKTESRKRNCKIPRPQTPKPCNLKPTCSPKTESKSTASPLLTDDYMTFIKETKNNAALAELIGRSPNISGECPIAGDHAIHQSARI